MGADILSAFATSSACRTGTVSAGRAAAPIEDRRHIERHLLLHALGEGAKTGEACAIDGGQDRDPLGQRPSDHRAEAAAVDFLLAELVDDKEPGARVRADRRLDQPDRLFQPRRVEPAALGERPEILADPHDPARADHMQVHVAAMRLTAVGIDLHRPGDRDALGMKPVRDLGQTPIRRAAFFRDDVAEHGFPLKLPRPEYKMPGETESRPMPPVLPILPDPADPRLTRRVTGTDQTGAATEISVVEERPLTIYLNSQEIVTAMTIGDYPDYLAVGFLRNQGMLRADDVVTGVDYDDEIQTVVVRTERQTSYEEKVKKKTRTSGCAVGTVFGDMMEGLEGLVLPPAEVRTSWLYALAKEVNTTTSLYLEAGAIHGTVLCQRDRALVYMEDVGRHNAVDKIAGYMFREGVSAADKILYTTGRLTSEMVIKTALMGIPVLASRSGFTAWGVEIARQVGLTLIGRMRGQRFVCLAGEERLVRDAALTGEDEDRRHRRKGAGDD